MAIRRRVQYGADGTMAAWGFSTTGSDRDRSVENCILLYSIACLPAGIY